MKPERVEVRIAAPAKINFGLRILARRPDGYHELDSLFLPLDLTDEIRLSAAPGSASGERSIDFDLRFADELGPASGDVPADRDNLAVRAARAFTDAAGISCKLTISLTKRIPAAAGLGGGSSDAAAVLRALAEVYPQALSESDLQRLALGLGADVPYFLDPRPAQVGGIGEEIEARLASSLTLLLANPGIPLSTAEVFRAWDAEGGSPVGSSLPERNPSLPERNPSPRKNPSLTASASASTMLPPMVPTPRVDLSQHSVANDLESAAIALCPAIAILRDGLSAAGAAAVGMSGSGPTVFGVFDNREAAEKASSVLTEVDRGRVEGLKERQGMRIWARVATTLHSL